MWQFLLILTSLDWDKRGNALWESISKDHWRCSPLRKFSLVRRTEEKVLLKKLTRNDETLFGIRVLQTTNKNQKKTLSQKWDKERSFSNCLHILTFFQIHRNMCSQDGRKSIFSSLLSYWANWEKNRLETSE